MAERKAPETNPGKDSSSADDKDRRDFMLSPKDLARLVKIVKSGSFAHSQELLTFAEEHVERLGVKVRGAEAIKVANTKVEDIPDKLRDITVTAEEVEEASSQVDVRAFASWMERIPQRAFRARKQLAGLYALLKGRVS